MGTLCEALLAAAEIPVAVDPMSGMAVALPVFWVGSVANGRDGGTMSRTAGLALLVLGIAVGALGLIMRFALEATSTGFNSHQAGIIFLVVGILLAVVAMVLLLAGSRNRSKPEGRS